MRLYTLTGATQVDDPEFGRFVADENGAFEFPNALSDRLHAFHVAGRQVWETDAERDVRLRAEELERLRDPATLARLLQASLRGSSPATPPAPSPPQAPETPAGGDAPVIKRAPRRSAAAK